VIKLFTKAFFSSIKQTGRFGREGKPRFLVFFKVDKTLPLIGPGNSTEEGEGVLE